MAGSRLRNSIVVLVFVTVAAVSAYLFSRGTADAAQPSGRQVALLSGPCWHVGVSDWVCPDSLAVRSADYVTSLSLTIETRDGKKRTVKLPAGVDAMFLTKDATERFLLPYYWATNRNKALALTEKLRVIKEPAAK